MARRKKKVEEVEEPVVEEASVEETEDIFDGSFEASTFTTLASGASGGGDGRLDVFNPQSVAWRGRMIDEGLI